MDGRYSMDLTIQQKTTATQTATAAACFRDESISFGFNCLSFPQPTFGDISGNIQSLIEKIRTYGRRCVSAPAISEEPDAAAAVGLDRGGGNICTIVDEKMAAETNASEFSRTNT